MNIKKAIFQLNVVNQCKQYGLSLWQCPQFLFMVMGLIIVGAEITAYAIGSHYVSEPEMVVLIVSIVTMILFTVANIIVHSFERLADANRMKSEFVKIVSHQLRSPLTNLSWAIDILMSGEFNEDKGKQLEYFEILKENSSRMKDLTQDLLTVSRIQEDSMPSTKEKVSLEGMVKNLIVKYQPFAKASNTEISLAVDKNLPEIFTNSHQIEIVLENFLDNAIRYVKDKGSIKIKISKRNKDIYLELRDNGVGIPKEDQRYIFQKFFRSKNVQRHQTQGTGLGLYISKSITEKLGGKIGFFSEEGIGSTFWFTLPLKNR